MLVILIIFDPSQIFRLLQKHLRKLCLFSCSLSIVQIKFLKPSSLVLSLCIALKSALLQVLNDTLLASDPGDSVMLILLDLTLAFDTVDHKTLLSLLEHFVGIQGPVLSCSYLTNRSFSVRLGNFSSLPAKLSCGVLQGSVLAPIPFSSYTSFGLYFQKAWCIISLLCR